MTNSTEWYDLFSRGARDWLRHNEKVREAVKRSLPNVIGGADVMSRPGNRTVQVPVRFLEHYRFRLAKPESHTGAGQGEVQPGDILRPGQPPGRGQGRGGSGEGEGEPQFVLELKVDDIVDWLWDELHLPNLKPKAEGPLLDEELVREGWDKQGARARLDRRRTMKEAIKRRAVQPNGAPFTNDDLRFRQLVKRKRPAIAAVVMFVLDASSSMRERDRQLAKSFFFWALQGLRRQYQHIESVFIAHTVTAWEFSEEEFFQVSAEGGTVVSSALHIAREIFEERYGAARYNGYLFYASDGENFPEDRHTARAELLALGNLLNFMGYVEVLPNLRFESETETGLLFKSIKRRGLPAASYVLSEDGDVWDAIRAFFRYQAEIESQE